MNVTVNVQDNISRTLDGIQKDLKPIPAQALDQMKQFTPIRNGNARSKTVLSNNSVIQANYPYATRLDNGYSKQAPLGMTKPLLNWLSKKLTTIIRKR